MEYIKFNELSEEDKSVQVKKATWLLLYKYINSFNKLHNAGLEPFEYFKLRGIPLNYDEVEAKLTNKEFIIKTDKDNTFDVIDRTKL